ncbi:MAG: hypothetical protein PHR26_01760 [Candidatus ainarchaeum sp.]|nr:hypothetical protein [Candidatus ainarchaeum sp.]MDD3975705.1 hypothetical protein [Candidatus ainarchaeum sp.]
MKLFNRVRKPKRETPHKIIEKTYKINELEAAFTKEKGKNSKLKEINAVRRKDSGKFVLGDIKDKFYHTHILDSLKERNKLIPSPEDIVTSSLLKRYKNVKNNGVFLIHKGKEIGKIHFRLSDKFIKDIREGTERASKTNKDINKVDFFNAFLKLRISNIYSFNILKDKMTLEKQVKIINELKKEGIQIKYKAMPGYKFNEKTMLFEKA